MASDSNPDFHHGSITASSFNRHAISCQSGTVNCYAPITQSVSSSVMTNARNVAPSNTTSMINSSVGSLSTIKSTNDLLGDNALDVKLETGMTVEWSPEDQTKLENGLDKYANEPSIRRYIKVAATLPNKTVRDVALRCRWMTKKDNAKRRKPDGYLTCKKLKDRKLQDKLLDSLTANILPQSQMVDMVAYPFMMHPSGHNHSFSTEVLPVGSVTKHLLEENAKVFSQIAANLAALNVQENIGLFHCARNNITAIMNDMREMPGLMSRMWPLPVSVDNDLANSIFLNADQVSLWGVETRVDWHFYFVSALNEKLICRDGCMVNQM